MLPPRVVAGVGELAEAAEDIDHRLGVEAGGGGVPQGEVADAVGVDVFGAFNEFGKGSDRFSCGSGSR